MKGVRHIGLLLLYLWVTVGLTVATHFCGGEPVSASLLAGTGQNAACCCGDEGEMEGCCNTSIATLRLEAEHTASSDLFVTSFDVEQIPSTEETLPPSAPSTSPAECGRPPGTSVPTHILACSLLI